MSAGSDYVIENINGIVKPFLVADLVAVAANVTITAAAKRSIGQMSPWAMPVPV